MRVRAATGTQWLRNSRECVPVPCRLPELVTLADRLNDRVLRADVRETQLGQVATNVPRTFGLRVNERTIRRKRVADETGYLATCDPAGPDPASFDEGRADPETFRRDILPRLHGLAITDLVAATGLSGHYCSMFRLGKRIPHPRHWNVLATCASSPELHGGTPRPRPLPDSNPPIEERRPTRR